MKLLKDVYWTLPGHLDIFCIDGFRGGRDRCEMLDVKKSFIMKQTLVEGQCPESSPGTRPITLSRKATQIMRVICRKMIALFRISKSKTIYSHVKKHSVLDPASHVFIHVSVYTNISSLVPCINLLQDTTDVSWWAMTGVASLHGSLLFIIPRWW